MTDAVPTHRAAARGTTVLLTIFVLCVLGWIGSWFLTPRPAWAHELPIVGLVCVAFASAVRRNAVRNSRRPAAGDAD